MDSYILKKLIEERESDPGFKERLKSFMDHEDKVYPKHHMEDPYGFYSFRRREVGEPSLKKIFENMSEADKREMWEAMMESHEEGKGKHFSHSYAKSEVSDMCHTESGNKHIGEKYPIEKAEEVFKRYKALLPEDTTIADVYVAINSHFHSYAQLFKAWFGENIDTKIVESAIVFWFRDEEFQDGEKLWKYFKMK